MNRTQNKKHKIASDRKAARARWRSRGRRKDVKVGDIIESCNLHLGVVKRVDPRSGDCEYISLMGTGAGSCDLYHCGVYVVPAKEAVMKLDVWNREGIEGLRKLWERQLLLA